MGVRVSALLQILGVVFAVVFIAFVAAVAVQMWLAVVQQIRDLRWSNR